MMVFCDETRRKDYVLVAAAVGSAPTAGRHSMRQLVLPGHARLHMKSEKSGRQRAILTAIEALGLVAATSYVARHATFRTQREARNRCLASLVQDYSHMPTQLILESDHSQDSRDRQTLLELTREHGCRDTLHYRHLRPTEDPLLWVPDALAWAFARGGAFRRQALRRSPPSSRSDHGHAKGPCATSQTGHEPSTSTRINPAGTLKCRGTSAPLARPLCSPGTAASDGRCQRDTGIRNWRRWPQQYPSHTTRLSTRTLAWSRTDELNRCGGAVRRGGARRRDQRPTGT